MNARTANGLDAAAPQLARLGDGIPGCIAACIGAQPGISSHRDDPDVAPVDAQHLLRRVLLHVPRFDGATLRRPGTIEAEVERLAAQVRALHVAVPEDLRRSRAGFALASSRLGPLSADVASTIHRSLHYLESPRTDGLHLGLYADGRNDARGLLSCVTLSPLDVPHLIASLPEGVEQDQVLVLSRLFAFEGSPANTISFCLARMIEAVRLERPEARLLLTYLNPNLGFTGAAYRAANWALYGHEPRTRYLYLDEDYVTERRMFREFGTNELTRLESLLGPRLSCSKVPLDPLHILAYDLRRSARRRPAGARDG
jgi:hypothetical protein